MLWTDFWSTAIHHISRPILFNSILRSHRQKFLKLSMHKTIELNTGYHSRVTFNYEMWTSFGRKMQKSKKIGVSKNFFCVILYSKWFKIQKCGHFQNSLIISNRLMYKLFDFEQKQIKLCRLKHFTIQNSNFPPYLNTKIFKNFFDPIFVFFRLNYTKMVSFIEI